MKPNRRERTEAPGRRLRRARVCVALLPLAVGCAQMQAPPPGVSDGSDTSGSGAMAVGTVDAAPGAGGGLVLSGIGASSSDSPAEPNAVKPDGPIRRNPAAAAVVGRSIYLTGTIRDLTDQHPDFERNGPPNAVYPGMVQATLGVDGKPQFGVSQWVTAASFSDWYYDKPGVNQPFQLSLELTEVPGTNRYSYADSAFFPIDHQGFGNQGRDHNFHFTSEFRGPFNYAGGEVFEFTGDDDLWVFINGGLVIDLGGAHSPASAAVNLDVEAARLGITPGNNYELALFHAERHTSESNFKIETTIALRPQLPK